VSATDLLPPDQRAAHDEAVAATSFRRDKRNGGWMIVGPMATAGQAVDGKAALVEVTKKSGEVKTTWIVDSRRYFVDDDGVQIYAATIEEAS